jgi:integrase
MMGCVYRRQVAYCTTCRTRLLTTVAQASCTAAHHAIETRTSKTWWIKYTRAGKSYAESANSPLKGKAIDLLRRREGDISHGIAVTPKMGRLTFEDAAKDLINDYTTNGKRSLVVVQRRVTKHLTPFFTGWKMANISTSDVRAYIAQRQTTDTVLVHKAVGDTPEVRRPASNAEINRELALLKRMFNLSIQAGKLTAKPHIPMLREDNVRTGFFEPDQLASVLAHLPDAIRPVIQFAAITGWRIANEVLPLQWRNVDFDADEVTLDPGATKNNEGRTFPLTAELRDVLKGQQAEHERWKQAGTIVPWVFFREVAEGRGGDVKPQPIISFNKCWQSACRAAGCPGRLPHDLRRTAIRTFVRKGIPEQAAMKLSGHRTRSVFDRYAIVSGSDLRNAARLLDEPNRPEVRQQQR